MLFCNDAGCFAADPDGAGGRYEKTVNDLQESGFSTSVWSEQTDDPAAFQSDSLLQVESYILPSAFAAIAIIDIL